jgi:hypothetical protein
MDPRFDLESAANYFHAFGFIKIPAFFSAQELQAIGSRFDHVMSERHGELDPNRNYLLPQFIDQDDELASILTFPRLNRVIESLMGEDFLYKGSDGNVFRRATGWHRDYLIRNKSCKVLIYFQKADAKSGALRVIPGTHFVDDHYSSLVGKALRWPEPPKARGFDEYKIFGEGHDPTVPGNNSTLPQCVVSTNPGDIIVFNHNLIHCTNASDAQATRRLLGLHFCRNPLTHPIKNMRNELMDDLRKLSLIEMDSFKLERMFGPKVFDHPSEALPKRISPLKGLKLTNETGFNGLYSAQTEDSINFCNRLKRTNLDEAKWIN